MDNRKSFQAPVPLESQRTLLSEPSSTDPPADQSFQSMDNQNQTFYNFIPDRNSMQLYSDDPNMDNQLYRYSKHDSIMLDPAALQGFERNMTLRYIPLTPQGNLVIDIPVADRVLTFSNYNNGSDFTHARYTAVTVGADDFVKKGYVLKQQEMDRKTEVFIVVTMYNEDHILFSKTMSAIMKNISYLCSLKNSRTWGSKGWQKVVVCIVSDGRSKIHRKVLDVLGIMGVYQDGIMKDSVNGESVVGHLFEYTTQVCVTKDLSVRGSNSGYCPVQIIFFLKEKNAKKVSDS